MQEVEVENEQELRIFVNGVPDFKLIPKEIAESLVSALELQISTYYEDKNKKLINVAASDGRNK